MQGLLMKVQDTVKKYAEIISGISRIDVEVVDDKIVRVAGTGIFADRIGESLYDESFAYRRVLETGKQQIIYQPGEEIFCNGCPHFMHCAEEVEISMPIRIGEEIIGVIGMAGNTREQKLRVMNNEQLYIGLLGQTADFISSKVKEEINEEKTRALIETLNCTIDHIGQGVLVMGKDGTVTYANTEAVKQLDLEEPEGAAVEVTETGDQINSAQEYRLTVNGSEYAVIGTHFEIPSPTENYQSVLIFLGSRSVKDRQYALASQVRSTDKSDIIGSSPATLRLKEEISKVAAGKSTVLITGESGTGKEMVATAIWKESDRRDRRFIALNCAAIPEAILESELFGYVKGAFTGADPNGRMGKFELANKGVIFLDEIGDMPLYLQSKLLRVLQERKIVRIGSNQLLPIDVRVIAATNKDLKKMIAEKRFREDLYYRLNVIPLAISPLRERKEDIEELTMFYIDRFSKLFGKRFWKITDDLLACLRRYPWYGNVRELENCIEYMVNIMDEDGILDTRLLPSDIAEYLAKQDLEENAATSGADPLRNPAPENRTVLPSSAANTAAMLRVGAEGESLPTLKELERQYILDVLEKYGNTTTGKKQAAKRLGIGLATLYRKLGEEGER